jgi:hypothetical protein
MFDHWATIHPTGIDFTVPVFNETIKNPLTAAIAAVNDIVKNYPPPYNLLASGGIDSQAMISAWKKSNHPFKVYTFRYNETYNWHDIKTLPEFCEREDIDYTIIDVDYFKFLEEEYDQIAKTYNCSSPQIAMHIKMASYFNEGTCIYSGNMLNSRNSNLTCAMLGLYRFSKTPEGKHVIPYFFLHLPELAYSLNQYSRSLSDADIDADPSDSENTAIRRRRYLYKVDLYRSAGFSVIPQQTKFTGFEKYKEHYDSHDYVLQNVKNRMKWNSKPSHRPFDWIFRYPYEELFGDTALSYVLNSYPYTIN